MARLLDALAAERAKGAGLREAVDKVRAQTIQECVTALLAGDSVEWALGTQDYGVRLLCALLPDVQADDREWLARNVSAATGYSRSELDELGGYRGATLHNVDPDGDWNSPEDAAYDTPATTCPGCGKRPCVCTTVVLG